MNSNEIIRKARLKKGLKQEEIAKVMGLQKTTICNYESGYSKPRGKNAKKLAAILEIPLENII